MIKLGIVGGGLNSAAGKAHIAAIRMTGRFKIVAGCFSRDAVVNAESAEEYGIAEENWAVNLSSLAELPCAIDRFVVLSPTPNHNEHVTFLAETTGRPILCEKALAQSYAEGCKLLKYQNLLSVVYNYSYYPAVRVMRQMIAEDIGVVSHIHAEMPQQGYLLNFPQKWRMTSIGLYLDLGAHLHHLIWFLTNENPQYVKCTERSYSQVGVIDYVSAQVSYESFQAHLWFSKVSAGNSNGLRLRVFGSKGSVEWYQRNPDVLVVNGHAAVEVANPRFKAGHPTGFVEALSNLYEDWADNLALPELSPQVACEGLRLIESMREASTTIGDKV